MISFLVTAIAFFIAGSIWGGLVFTFLGNYTIVICSLLYDKVRRQKTGWRIFVYSFTRKIIIDIVYRQYVFFPRGDAEQLVIQAHCETHPELKRKWYGGWSVITSNPEPFYAYLNKNIEQSAIDCDLLIPMLSQKEYDHRDIPPT